MNTLVLLLMTSCVNGADPAPVAVPTPVVSPVPAATVAPSAVAPRTTPVITTESVPMNSYTIAPEEAPKPQRTGFFTRLRNAFSRRPAESTMPSGTVITEPPVASGTVSPVITSSPAPSSLPSSVPASSAPIKSAQRMPGGTPSN